MLVYTWCTILHYMWYCTILWYCKIMLKHIFSSYSIIVLDGQIDRHQRSPYHSASADNIYNIIHMYLYKQMKRSGCILFEWVKIVKCTWALFTNKCDTNCFVWDMLQAHIYSKCHLVKDIEMKLCSIVKLQNINISIISHIKCCQMSLCTTIQNLKQIRP